ncbi:metal-dependent hydrolase [Natronorarus salvus]|uniref:metal-dependent hydrolase n=1 Tax=Natronorarus salvus TaxID=3117733 RepID=UPI003908172C
MMPWEHVIIGYIAYSVVVHLVYRDSPTAGETVVVVIASVLPDAIDKPLAWEFGVFAGGYALGHSVFFAVPLALVVGALASRLGRPRIGVAFAIGYLLHLPFDVLPGFLREGELKIDRLLWPVRERGGSPGAGFREELIENVVPYARAILEPDPSPYALVLFGTLLLVALLWVYDGMPVAREAYVFARRRVRASGSDAAERSGRDR